MTPTPQEPGTAQSEPNPEFEAFAAWFCALPEHEKIGRQQMKDGWMARALLAAKQPEPPSDLIERTQSALCAELDRPVDAEYARLFLRYILPAMPAGPTSEPVARIAEALTKKIQAACREKPTHLNGYGIKLWSKIEADIAAALAAVPLPSETPCK